MQVLLSQTGFLAVHPQKTAFSAVRVKASPAFAALTQQPKGLEKALAVIQQQPQLNNFYDDTLPIHYRESAWNNDSFGKKVVKAFFTGALWQLIKEAAVYVSGGDLQVFAVVKNVPDQWVEERINNLRKQRSVEKNKFDWMLDTQTETLTVYRRRLEASKRQASQKEFFFWDKNNKVFYTGAISEDANKWLK